MGFCQKAVEPFILFASSVKIKGIKGEYSENKNIFLYYFEIET
jgi:hypothetical protein